MENSPTKEFADKPPALIEMAKLLPQPGSVFPLRRRLAWLRAFQAAASFYYGFDPNDIEIVIEPDADLGGGRQKLGGAWVGPRRRQDRGEA